MKRGDKIALLGLRVHLDGRDAVHLLVVVIAGGVQLD
jgi:hypothetical protein